LTATGKYFQYFIDSASARYWRNDSSSQQKQVTFIHVHISNGSASTIRGKNKTIWELCSHLRVVLFI